MCCVHVYISCRLYTFAIFRSSKLCLINIPGDSPQNYYTDSLDANKAVGETLILCLPLISITHERVQYDVSRTFEGVNIAISKIEWLYCSYQCLKARFSLSTDTGMS